MNETSRAIVNAGFRLASDARLDRAQDRADVLAAQTQGDREAQLRYGQQLAQGQTVDPSAEGFSSIAYNRAATNQEILGAAQTRNEAAKLGLDTDKLNRDRDQAARFFAQAREFNKKGDRPGAIKALGKGSALIRNNVKFFDGVKSGEYLKSRSEDERALIQKNNPSFWSAAQAGDGLVIYGADEDTQMPIYWPGSEQGINDALDSYGAYLGGQTHTNTAIVQERERLAANAKQLANPRQITLRDGTLANVWTELTPEGETIQHRVGADGEIKSTKVPSHFDYQTKLTAEAATAEKKLTRKTTKAKEANKKRQRAAELLQKVIMGDADASAIHMVLEGSGYNFVPVKSKEGFVTGGSFVKIAEGEVRGEKAQGEIDFSKYYTPGPEKKKQTADPQTGTAQPETEGEPAADKPQDLPPEEKEKAVNWMTEPDNPIAKKVNMIALLTGKGDSREVAAEILKEAVRRLYVSDFPGVEKAAKLSSIPSEMLTEIADEMYAWYGKQTASGREQARQMGLAKEDR